jgi:hypothetical protein
MRRSSPREGFDTTVIRDPEGFPEVIYGIRKSNASYPVNSAADTGPPSGGLNMHTQITEFNPRTGRYMHEGA